MKRYFQRQVKLRSNTNWKCDHNKSQRSAYPTEINYQFGLLNTTKSIDITFAKVWLNHIFNHYGYFLLKTSTLWIWFQRIIHRPTAVLQKNMEFNHSILHKLSSGLQLKMKREQPSKCCILVKLAIKHSIW